VQPKVKTEIFGTCFLYQHWAYKYTTLCCGSLV